MASIEQIRASRANGALSKGPVTPEGKARSARNATKHGMHSRAVVLNNESQEMYEDLLGKYVAELQPATTLEHDLVVEIVNATWRLNRVMTVETAVLDLEMDNQREQIHRDVIRIDEPTRAAMAYNTLAETGSSLHLLNRSETRLRRAIERALDRLERLQDKRKSKNCENEPEAA